VSRPDLHIICDVLQQREADPAISELDSLNTWRLFASAYPTEMAAPCQDHKMSIPELNGLDTHSVVEAFKFMTAPDFQWMTILCLQNVTISRPQLDELSRIHNLGALAICNNNRRALHSTVDDSNFDDSVIRAWSRHAEESGAFPKLQVLALENCHKIMNVRVSLEYLRALPALELCAFGSRKTAFKGESRLPVGWKLLDGR